MLLSFMVILIVNASEVKSLKSALADAKRRRRRNEPPAENMKQGWMKSNKSSRMP